ncbi:Trm112 family protein [Nocardioidaceae bacterium]|nr:Trm112 family protein [Nocardioidaceae bacterium]
MNLDKTLLDLLACPQCHGGLRADEEREELVCETCRLAYPVRDDIPVMLVDDARSTA